MSEEKPKECKLKNKGGGDYYCETCGSLGKSSYLMAECPNKDDQDSYDLLSNIYGGIG